MCPLWNCAKWQYICFELKHKSGEIFFPPLCPTEKMGANAWYSQHGFELIHA